MSNVKDFLLRITVISLLIIMILTCNANAYTRKSWSGFRQEERSYTTEKNSNSFLNKFTNGDYNYNFNFGNTYIPSFDMNDMNFNQEEYDLSSLKFDLENMDASGYISKFKIKDLINKLPDGYDKDILEEIRKYTSSSEVIDELLAKISELLGENGSFGDFNLGDFDFGNLNFGDMNFGDFDFGSLDFGNMDFGSLDFGSILGGNENSNLPTPEDVYIDAETATIFAGEKYRARLHASVYLNDASNNWVVLVHPFMLSGTSIAGSVGDFYYEKGYNIIAPDLRGFGESEGSVALGFLESLDIYDWIVMLQEYNPENVFVHGVSLGGATTNFLSGIDGFMNNAPANIRINKEIQSLESGDVIGLIEDCGYTDMTEFEDKNSLLSRGIGLDESNFDYYSDARNSLKYCELPILAIHGTSDTTVNPSNVDVIEENTLGEVTRWDVQGGSHAFIVMGSNSGEYKKYVQNFIDENIN